MSFKPMNTKEDKPSFTKTVLYATHGFGKTTQAKHYQKKYGKGFILSGEAGLSSIRSAGIDYLPFTSFDGAVDAGNGIYSFTELCRIMMSPDFISAGYKWIMLDSVTELSEMIDTWSRAKAEREAAELGKKVNGFDIFTEYNSKMVGACKFIRNLPYQVCLTALANAKENEAGTVEFTPLLHSNKVGSQIAGIFDNVFGGVITSTKAADPLPPGVKDGYVTERFIVTGKYGGWHGKVRDEHNVVQLIEKTGSVIDVLSKIEASEKGGAK